VGQRVTVELKNDMEVEGRLDSVDQFLNVKLADVRVVNEEKYPHLVSTRECVGVFAVTKWCLSSWR
jgi:U6 snRNA-associated Sm-like protein LSm2